MTTGVHVILSPQQLIDCVKLNRGCAGGDIGYAMAYIIQYDTFVLTQDSLCKASIAIAKKRDCAKNYGIIESVHEIIHETVHN